MCSPERSARRVAVLAILLSALTAWPSAQEAPPSPGVDRARVLETMKRATTFMVETVSVQGGYVWSYLPDLSRRWGEMEARPTMIWIQPPGTATMGHLFLDALHATGDDYYYRAAEGVAGALILAQHPAGGWNYVADTAGEPSLRAWYDTVGKHGWRLEEFQHYWGNATFDDAGTAESARLPAPALRREARSEVPSGARQGDPVRARQPVPDGRLAAALSAAPRVRQAWQARLHVVPDLQRRRRRREHRVPAAVLPGTGRRPPARRRPPRHGRVPGHPAGPAAGRLGPAVHARS